jgi:hypothetical protein
MTEYWSECKGLKREEIEPITSLIGKCCCKCSQLAKIWNRDERAKFKYACVTAYNQRSPLVDLKKTQHGICECFEDIKQQRLIGCKGSEMHRRFSGLIDVADQKVYEGDLVSPVFGGEFNNETHCIDHNTCGCIYRVVWGKINMDFDGFTLEIVKNGAHSNINGSSYLCGHLYKKLKDQ